MRPALRHPLVRLGIGVSVGFLGAVATITAIEGLAQHDRPDRVANAALGVPDFASYCLDRGLTSVQVGEGTDRWRCVGRINGFWTHLAISPEDVCREQYASASARAAPADVTGWACVAVAP